MNGVGRHTNPWFQARFEPPDSFWLAWARGEGSLPKPAPQPPRRQDEGRDDPPPEDQGRQDSGREPLQHAQRGGPGTGHHERWVPGGWRFRGAAHGLNVEGDLGHVAALLEVLHPAVDLLYLTPHAGELALDGERVLHVVGPVVQVEKRLLRREKVPFPRLQIHVLFGHVLAGDGVGRNLLPQAPELVQGILEVFRGDREDEVRVQGVTRAVRLRAHDGPPESGDDLLGGRRLATNVLRGYAKLRR